MDTVIWLAACGILFSLVLTASAWASSAEKANPPPIALSRSSIGAPSDAEKADLARLIHELTALKPLLAQAQRDANPDARVTFQYRWLRTDLDKIMRGIRAYLDGTRDLPRSIKPLQGDYAQ
jgi:RAQPRD family integrative conjugative element protein